MLRDEPLIEKARSVAIQLIKQDPTLEKSPELALAVAALREEESSTYMDKG